MMAGQPGVWMTHTNYFTWSMLNPDELLQSRTENKIYNELISEKYLGFFKIVVPKSSNNVFFKKQVTEKTNISAVNSGFIWSASTLSGQDLFMKVVAHKFTMFIIMCLSVCPCSVMIVYLCVYLCIIWRWITSHPCGFSITLVTGQALVMTCESSVLLSG